MKTILTSLALLMTALASSASAQWVNLSGRWQCVAMRRNVSRPARQPCFHHPKWMGDECPQ